MPVLSGLEVFKLEYHKKYRGCRLGLLSNQASVSIDLIHASDIISNLCPGDLKVLFGPQHGYAGEDQDNMIETGHTCIQPLQRVEGTNSRDDGHDRCAPDRHAGCRHQSIYFLINHAQLHEGCCQMREKGRYPRQAESAWRGCN